MGCSDDLLCWLLRNNRSPTLMLACADVHYNGNRAKAALVLFRDWTACCSVRELAEEIEGVEQYLPGQFYLRELPCILSVVSRLSRLPETIVVDGYVWLDGEQKAGLGARLYEALDHKVAIVGVAKSSYHGAVNAKEIYRGRSRRPLFITAAGIELWKAAQCVANMSGPFRIPNMIKRVDQIARGRLDPKP